MVTMLLIRKYMNFKTSFILLCLPFLSLGQSVETLEKNYKQATGFTEKIVAYYEAASLHTSV